MKLVIVFYSQQSYIDNLSFKISQDLNIPISHVHRLTKKKFLQKRKSNSVSNLNDYDIVLLGTSVNNKGIISNEMVRFVEENKEVLKKKKLIYYQYCKKYDGVDGNVKLLLELMELDEKQKRIENYYVLTYWSFGVVGRGKGNKKEYNKKNNEQFKYDYKLFLKNIIREIEKVALLL